jgi:HK97 family phage major capsid protein
MSDMDEIKSLVIEQGASITGWKSAQDRRLAELEKRMNRPGALERMGGDTGYTRELGQALRKAALGDDRELKGMSASSDPEGGYLLIPQMDQTVRQIRDQVSPVSALARNIELDSGAEMLLPYFKGTLTASWVGETEARPETATVDAGQHRIELNEVYAMPVVTQKLLDTANYDVGMILVDQIAHGLAAAEADAIHVGNGVGKPRGFTTYTTAATADATRAWGQIEHIASGGSGAFASGAALDKLMDAEAALKPQYRVNAKWVMGRGAANVARKLKSSGGGDYLWQPAGAAGQPPTLLGYEVIISDATPTVASDSLSIWLGDWEQFYTVVRMPGLRLLQDPFSTKGSVGFYAYSRVGGAVTNTEAAKTIKFATS